MGDVAGALERMLAGAVDSFSDPNDDGREAPSIKYNNLLTERQGLTRWGATSTRSAATSTPYNPRYARHILTPDVLLGRQMP